MAEEYKLTEQDKDLIKKLVDIYDREDLAVRNLKIRKCREMKLYWNGLSNIYWSESARDFRIFNYNANPDAGTNDQEYYNRNANVFRAFLETIIAALAISIPSISCSPDDADNPNDQSTAKAGDKIAELLYKHNDAIFVWLRALYIYVTEGLVACQNIVREDEKFGTYKEPQYKEDKIEAFQCPACAAKLEDSVMTAQQTGQQLDFNELLDEMSEENEDFSAGEMDEFGPGDDDIDLHSEIVNEGPECPECGAELDPELQKSTLTIPRLVGYVDKPKGRICFDLFGELYVKIANYARFQADTPYLIKSYETTYVNVLECYRDNEELWNKLPKGTSSPNTPDPYESFARANVNYRETYPEDQVTVKEAWLRPASYNHLTQEQSETLHKNFPDGIKAVVVNNIVAEGCNANLDDEWTLTINPTSDFLSFNPVGELLKSIQDTTSDLISLVLQTIEHGIEQTFVDPAVLDLDAYGQQEANPGIITGAKPGSVQGRLGDAFYSTKTASLSPEVFQFFQVIQQLGQFVSSAMPSLFGGSQEKGASKTASEYAMSRTASLQRLQTPWRMFSIWWKNVFGKAIPAYMKLMKDDERYVKKDEYGNFINVWIRKAELSGKIGDIELESADTMPVSDEQKADTIMKLMELNNQEILGSLFSPENISHIRKLIKLPEFKLPGEEDRQKQYEEIQQLVVEAPQMLAANTQEAIAISEQQGVPPQDQELPSIMPEELVDNHQIQAEICRIWLVGEAGRLAKNDNPDGYKNVMLHMKAHLDILQQQQMQAAMAMQAANQPPQGENTGSPDKAKPKQEGSNEIKGANDAVQPIQ